MRRGIVVIFISLLLLVSGSGGLYFPPIELAAAPYRYDLLSWEISHLPDKWIYKLKTMLPWNSRSREEKLEELEEFFRIGQEIRSLERELSSLRLGAPGNSLSQASPGAPELAKQEGLSETIKDLRRQRSRIKAAAEEALESEVSAVLAKEGLDSRIGLIFPPVDVALTDPPRVLVVSPRDRIERMKTLLLKAGMGVEDMEELENEIFTEQDLSSLVVGIGGVATYPFIVRADSTLRQVARTAAHEWLHTYWFFRPLGWNYFDGANMRTLNETAADMAGDELGDRVYEAITGEKIQEPPDPASPPTDDEQRQKEIEKPVEEVFSFSSEMRKTRLRVDELLLEGKVEQAEAYMEEQRLLFVANGYHIRKLNQAYFAFFGTYSANPASVSPIEGEVQELRSSVGSVGDFIRTMRGFGSYQEFKEHLSQVSVTSRPDGMEGPSNGLLISPSFR